MAKTITIPLAEYEYMKQVIAHDGMTIAKLEVEVAQAKKDIKRLLVFNNNMLSCQYCACDPEKCTNCEHDAVWRGYSGSDEQT